MKPIKRRVSYVFRNRRLYLRIFYDKEKLDISTGYEVEKEKFDGRRCKPSTTHGEQRITAYQINLALEEWERKVDAAFYSYEISDQTPTMLQIKGKLTGEKPGERKDFWAVYNQYIIESSKSHYWAANTTKSVRNVMGLLRKFDSKLTYDTLTAEKLRDFIEWQSSNRYSDLEFTDKQPGYSNPTILKNCRVLKWFLKWSVDHGYLDGDILLHFPPKLKKVDKPVIFLTWKEFLRVLNHRYDEYSESDMARDFFCFCCLTSLRVSDAMSLKLSDDKGDHIELVSKKTNTATTIELNKESRRILDKYKGRFGNLALPVFKLPRLNALIKAIGAECGVDEEITITQFYGTRKVSEVKKKYELLSSHCGRRTFVCNALYLGIAPHVIMKWTGHTEYSAMKPYMDIADEQRRNSMAAFDAAMEHEK